MKYVLTFFASQIYIGYIDSTSRSDYVLCIKGSAAGWANKCLRPTIRSGGSVALRKFLSGWACTRVRVRVPKCELSILLVLAVSQWYSDGAVLDYGTVDLWEYLRFPLSKPLLCCFYRACATVE